MSIEVVAILFLVGIIIGLLVGFSMTRQTIVS